jgi:hypothetical protein
LINQEKEKKERLGYLDLVMCTSFMST